MKDIKAGVLSFFIVFVPLAIVTFILGGSVLAMVGTTIGLIIAFLIILVLFLGIFRIIRKSIR